MNRELKIRQILLESLERNKADMIWDRIIRETSDKIKNKEGCGVLFKGGSGIIVCGERRTDGNKFLCDRCLGKK